MSEVRIEEDSIGRAEIPADALYGIHTLRALENYQISGVPISEEPFLIQSLAEVKKACALANGQLGLMSEKHVEAIVYACDQLIDGQYHECFSIDFLQGGAGTSVNMVANEVIANLGLLYMGFSPGNYQHLSPLDHVNKGQSTNDVYPTAFRLCALRLLSLLQDVIFRLCGALQQKGLEYSDVLLMGRTQLQDAVPLSAQQMFDAYANVLHSASEALDFAQKGLLSIHLGGTAIGTGITTHPQFSELVTPHLSQVSGFSLIATVDRIASTQDVCVFLRSSNAVQEVAVSVSKIAHDMRLLSSGPAAGFSDLKLPERANGSSIMPGKINPVIPEVVNQVAFDIIGKHFSSILAAEAGQLQLNAFAPVMLKNISNSVRRLVNVMDTFSTLCISGITINREVQRARLETCSSMVTAFLPLLGYEMCSKIAKESLKTGKPVLEVAAQISGYSADVLCTYMTKEKLGCASLSAY